MTGTRICFGLSESSSRFFFTKACSLYILNINYGIGQVFPNLCGCKKRPLSQKILPINDGKVKKIHDQLSRKSASLFGEKSKDLIIFCLGIGKAIKSETNKRIKP